MRGTLLKGIIVLASIIGAISSFILFVVSISTNDGKLGVTMLIAFFISSISCVSFHLSLKNEW